MSFEIGPKVNKRHSDLVTFNLDLTLSQATNFRLFQIPDDKFKFNENGRKFSQRIGDTVGKGEIARNEQFLLFPQCFKKLYCRQVKTSACFFFSAIDQRFGPMYNNRFSPKLKFPKL